MKSAYELAMERLSKTAPSKSLSPAQKAELGELESLYKSRFAQLDLRTQDALAAAREARDADKMELIRTHFIKEKAQMESEHEAKRARIRNP